MKYIMGFFLDGNWTTKERINIYNSVRAVGTKLQSVSHDNKSVSEVFKKNFKKVTYTKSIDPNHSQNCQGSQGNVVCYSHGDGSFTPDERNLTHELGHIFSQNNNEKPYADLKNPELQLYDSQGNWVMGTHKDGRNKGQYERTVLGYKSGFIPDVYHGQEWTDFQTNANEDYADMFLNWVYDSFDYSLEANQAGVLRYNWIEDNVSKYVK